MIAIIVKVDHSYGQTRIYPVCKKAIAVAQMVNKKTLSPHDLQTMQFLGHPIEIEDMSEEAMERHEKLNWLQL